MTAKVESNSQGGMTYYFIEGTAEEVQETIAAIESSYHPLGYGTSFMPMTPKGDGLFRCAGQRSNSCD